MWEWKSGETECYTFSKVKLMILESKTGSLGGKEKHSCTTLWLVRGTQVFCSMTSHGVPRFSALLLAMWCLGPLLFC